MKSRAGKIALMITLPMLLVAFGIVLWMAQPAQAALTIATTAADEWAEVAQNAVREGATTTISDCYAAQVVIKWALTSPTAHTGTKIDVQLSSQSSGDEGWFTLTSFITKTGTPNLEALTATEPATETTIACASTTGLYDDDETRWIFIEDNTVANSELVYLVSHVADTSVTIQDGLTNEHDTSDTMYDIAGTTTIALPCPGPSRVRVIYDNTYDSDGATCHTFSEVIEVTAL